MQQRKTEEPRSPADVSPASQAPAADETAELRDTLLEINRVINALNNDDSICCGATLSQGNLMQHLWRAGEPTAMTVLQMSEALGLAPSTVTRTIDPLWKRGWVERTRSATDRRQVWLSLTPEGEAIAAQQDARAQSLYRSILAQVPKHERSATLRALGTVLNAWKHAQAACCGSDQRIDCSDISRSDEASS